MARRDPSTKSVRYELADKWNIRELSPKTAPAARPCADEGQPENIGCLGSPDLAGFFVAFLAGFALLAVLVAVAFGAAAFGAAAFGAGSGARCACSYASTTAAGIRPRPETSCPASRAHSRMACARSRAAESCAGATFAVPPPRPARCRRLAAMNSARP